MKPEHVTVYRCKHGHVWESAEEAATCNLTTTLLGVVTREKKPDLPYEPFSTAPLLQTAEAAIVSFWIRKNTALLEHLIGQFIDDCMTGQPPVITPATDEKS
jgi:hypothetical protein